MIRIQPCLACGDRNGHGGLQCPDLAVSARLINALPIFALLAITGCASSSESVKQILDKLEFKEGESGCLRMDGEVVLGNIPIFSTKARLNYKKSKPLPQQPAPEC